MSGFSCLWFGGLSRTHVGQCRDYITGTGDLSTTVGSTETPGYSWVTNSVECGFLHVCLCRRSNTPEFSWPKRCTMSLRDNSREVPLEAQLCALQRNGILWLLVGVCYSTWRHLSTGFASFFWHFLTQRWPFTDCLYGLCMQQMRVWTIAAQGWIDSHLINWVRVQKGQLFSCSPPPSEWS